MKEEMNKLLKKEINRCNRITDFNKRLSCKSKLLYQVTEIQDYANLNIMSDFRKSDPGCSQDERWIPVHMVDNANAIILGISRNKFDPKYFLREGYVEEKVDALNNKWRYKLDRQQRGK